MNLERSFGYLVHDVARLFARRFSQRALLFVGLTRSQCRILSYLARHEGINQAGLAELLEIKPMTLVRQIDRLEQEGWVERRPHPTDRRARRLMLTDKARPLLARILELSSEVRREAFARLSDEEGRHLVELLRRVHGNLAETPSLPLVAEPLPVRAESEKRRMRRTTRLHAGWPAVGEHR
jgi:MarR family transcriptional regulator, transcriptional regulator for hemolysin